MALPPRPPVLRDDLLYTVRCVQLDATYSIELLQLAMYASLCQQQWSCPTVDRLVQSSVFSDIHFVGSLSCNEGYNLDQTCCAELTWTNVCHCTGTMTLPSYRAVGPRLKIAVVGALIA